MNQHRLSQWEAVSLMVGAGVGAGIMAVPYLTVQVGLAGLILILPAAWAASSLIHLMLAEVLFRTGRDLQIVELMRLYVLGGRVGRWLLWSVFALLSVAFLANLAAYVSGAGEILAGMSGLNRHAAEFLVYLLSAGVVFFGLKGVGVAERYGALILAGVVLVLGIGAAAKPFHLDFKLAGSGTQWLALYGMVMYALWTFYSVPQVVRGLGADRRGAVRAILTGLGINGALTLLVALIALGISDPVTEVAIIGIAARMGDWAGLAGSIFIMVALITSYWSVSLALADILHERTGLPARWAWLLATLPSLLVLWMGVWQFLEWLRLAAGATALVVALITLPMYWKARKTGPVSDPGWTLACWGHPAMLALALLALILMAVGSVVSVN
ncbi:MAG TPA: aromatic amino acid transport family protein [Anaerolineaceae bacterium]|nr:aromatic amino acid transport family protein [Anaerolineaceae bacterium]HPN53534.1 aromatic amino acid transport family protein [Anaerolineaceae bacterium]